MRSFPQYYNFYIILAILLFTLKCPSPALATPHCTEEFWKELDKLNVSHCHTNGLLRAEFGWTFNNNTRRLDIMFGTRLHGETGWLAWGLNLDEVGMVGTQALIGIKHTNGSLSWGQYNVTDATKLGCPLVPSDDIGLNVHNFSFIYLQGLEYYVIRATMILPSAYNSSKTNVVVQMGEAVSEVGPLIHPFSLKHLDNTEKMNLVTSEPVNYLEHQQEKLRQVHGAFNIVGLGTMLPLGVIVARYFKKWDWWYAAHVFLQTIGYTIGSVSWAIGLWLGSASKHYQFHTHRVFGIIIYTCATMQVLAFSLKPNDGSENNKYWKMYHHSLGYILLVLIWVNIFQGIKIIQPSYVWNWTFVGILGALGTLVLALEMVNWYTHCKKRKQQKAAKETKVLTDKNGNVTQDTKPDEASTEQPQATQTSSSITRT